jgi:excisionase family DNA binding protein
MPQIPPEQRPGFLHHERRRGILDQLPINASRLKANCPTGPPIAPLAYRIPDAVRVSGVSKSKLYALAAEGKLRLSRVGGRTLISHAELQRLIDEGCAA